jgi:hypothetical protein
LCLGPAGRKRRCKHEQDAEKECRSDGARSHDCLSWPEPSCTAAASTYAGRQSPSRARIVILRAAGAPSCSRTCPDWFARGRERSWSRSAPRRFQQASPLREEGRRPGQAANGSCVLSSALSSNEGGSARGRSHPGHSPADTVRKKPLDRACATVTQSAGRREARP